MGARIFSRTVAFVATLALINPALAGAVSSRGKAGEKKGSTTTSEGACDAMLESQPSGKLVSNAKLSNLSARFEEMPFDVLVDPNPENNLAVRFPTIVMDLNQIAYQAILKYKSRKIKDPTYPIVEHDYYPIFSSGVDEAGGAAIIGQYEAIQRFVGYAKLRASGQAKDNSLLLTGPAGTGKTEFLTITDRMIAHQSAHAQDSYQYTFKFVGLEHIPALSPIVNPDTGTYLVNTPADSPLTLLDLAPDVRDRVVEMAASRVEDLIGYSPRPWTHMHPQVERIVLELVQHYQRQKKKSDITEQEYIDILKKHVVIVRNYIDPNRDPITVDYQGDHPDPAMLYGSENPMLSIVLGKSNPLSFAFDGKVMQLHGRLGAFDEFFRNKAEMQNFSLKIIQSGVVEANGAPAMRLNTLPVAVSNDESVAAAREEGGTKALLNRFMKEPMRQPIHPTLTAETALYMAADRKLGGTFHMRSLTEPDAQLQPAKLSELFPEPDERGNLLSPEKRFAIYYTPKKGTRILIAPRALELLGLTTAGTRIETDVKKLQAFPNKFADIVGNMNVFQDVTMRLKVIRREIVPQAGVLRDLRDIMFLLREGENGITARDAKRWLLKALEYAETHGLSAVTPVTIDRMLAEMVTKGEFDGLKNDIAARWMLIHNKIKVDFILPFLTQDIQAIVGGDSGLVDKLYNEIVEEIRVLASDPEGQEWSDEGGERRMIDHERLKEIGRIYEKLNNEPFNLGRIQSFMQNRRGGEDFLPLRHAVENFLLQKELSTSAMSELLDYFEGKSVTDATRTRAQQAESSMERFGYNKDAFRQALGFVRAIQNELRKSQRRVQQ
ncbi:MAG: hypothetical protein AB7N80_12365 [Bdellovibrionales bacterium]